MGCPITWVSKMQSEIALSTTEAEYISMSQSIRDLIPMTRIIQEIKDAKHFNIGGKETTCYSTVFEDNKSALELANCPKYRPRTKYIALKYHFFRSWITKGLIKIKSIGAKEQQADIFTKPLEKSQFETLRRKILGW